MNKDIDGQGHCEEHQCWYEDTRGCPKCYPKRYPERYPQPNPPNLEITGDIPEMDDKERQRALKMLGEEPSLPTDPKRPDVEDILKQATAVAPFGHGTDNASTIALCGHIDRLEAKLKAAETVLAGLVEAVEKYRDEIGMPKNSSHVFNAELEAAKQHLKTAETVLERKKGE